MEQAKAVLDSHRRKNEPLHELAGDIELLVGKTNRAFSQEAVDALAHGDFPIALEDSELR